MNTNWTEQNIAELFDAYDDWVENAFGYQPLIAELTCSYGKGISVLDYGCGSGKVSRRLRDDGFDYVTGVDISPTMIEKAISAGTNRLRFEQIHGPNLPFPDNSFEAVISCFLFINIPERRELVRITTEVMRVLKPGGSYYILDTHPQTTGVDYPTYRNGEHGISYQDGDNRPVYLTIPGRQQPLEIVDKQWGLSTYRNTFAAAGLSLTTERNLPFDNSQLPVHTNEFHTLQDTKPYILLRATKQ